jgi:NAD+ kinase
LQSRDARRPVLSYRGRREIRIDVEAGPRLGCVCSDSERARAAFAEIEHRYQWTTPEDCDVLVVLGGDGFLLHVMHRLLKLEQPIFGMNRGTVGFLLNQFRPDGLLERIAAATRIDVHPLAVRAVTTGADTVNVRAFNEVAVTRDSAQSVNIRVRIDGVERLENFVGDGLIIATAAGSTAYNFSAHGPILPLGSRLVALTPVSPFRPRRWRGALLPHSAEIVLDNLDPIKRPAAATADFRELLRIESVTIRQDLTTAVQLLFDPDHSLEERIIAEQFLS